jgi:general L-amino acid transport system substrate-binding protein
LAKNFEILPDVIAKDPLAPTYRLDDPQWAAIVNWTVNALILAEESGVTKANLSEKLKSDDPVIKRLLGTQRGYGQFIGLDDAWAARVVEAVGNYGEIFERDLGSSSAMKLARGPNHLWTNGGLLYAFPMRGFPVH